MALVHERGWDPALFDANPWFSALSDVLEPFRAHRRFPALEELSSLLAERYGRLSLPTLKPVAMAPKGTHRKKRKAPVEPSSLYDVRISEHGELPTRLDDWHDFFNVLAFAAWPRSKRALHARQSRLLRARLSPESLRLPGARTREQDALTLLDEGGVIVACNALAFAELARCGDDLSGPLDAFVAEGAALLVPFGHALFEHMIEGLECPLAIPQLVLCDAASRPDFAVRDELDQALSEQLLDPHKFAAPSGLKGLPLDRYSRLNA